MRIIAKKTLKEFWEKNPKYSDAQKPLEAWHEEVKRSNWKNSQEVKDKYGDASIIGDSRVVFNIHGNKYRLVVKVNYQIAIVYIRFIGTHNEYDKINAKEV